MRYGFWLVSAGLFLLSGAANGQAAKRTVCGSGCDYTPTFASFAQALNDAVAIQNTSCVQVILEIAAGTTIDAGGGTWTLPAKSCKQYITIRSAGASAFTDGTRLDPASQSGNLATLKGSNPTGVLALITTSPAALTSYWRLEGIEFNVTGGNNNSPYLYGIFLGDTGSTFPASADRAQRPHHIELKHCWFHGVPGARNLSNGVGVLGNSIRILDSYFEAIATDGGEAHSIAINFSDGPFEARNNRLSSATEVVLIGGALAPAGLIPSFLTFAGNAITKDPYYKFGNGTVDPTWPCRQGYVHRNTGTNHDWICNGSSAWVDQGGLSGFGPDVVKNHFECKICRGVRLYGNEFSNSWVPAAQDPSWVTLNLQTQGTSSNPGWIVPYNLPQPWTTIGDVAIFGNVGHDGVAAQVILGFPGIDCGGSCLAGSSGQVCSVSTAGVCYPLGHNHIRVHNNLFYNIGDARDFDAGSADGEPIGYSLNSGASDISIFHNTTVMSTFPGTPAYNRMGFGPGDGTMFGQISFRDNITPSGNNGLRVNNTAQFPAVFTGECTLVKGTGPRGGEDARNNVFTVDGGSAWSPPSFGSLGSCASGSDAWTSGRNAANGAIVVEESTPTFRALPAFQGIASDGRDPGADIDLIQWLEAGAASGAPNPGLDFKLKGAVATVQLGGRGAVVYFSSYDASTCTVIASADYSAFLSPVSATVVQTGRSGVATWVPGTLLANRMYWVQATCNGKKLEWGVDGQRFRFVSKP